MTRGPVALHVRDRNAAHVRVAVFVGPPGSRGLAGELILRVDEWDDLVAGRRHNGHVLVAAEVVERPL